jgi:hypothetical protein
MGMLYLYFIYIYIYTHTHTHTHTHITFTWMKNFPDPMCSTHSSFSRRRFFHFANSINDDSSSKAWCWLADVPCLPLQTQLSHLHKIKKCISEDGSLGICNILHIKQTSTAACTMLPAHILQVLLHTTSIINFPVTWILCKIRAEVQPKLLSDPGYELALHKHHNTYMTKVLVHSCTLQPDMWMCHMSTPHCTTHLMSKLWWTVYSNIITSCILKYTVLILGIILIFIDHLLI